MTVEPDRLAQARSDDELRGLDVRAAIISGLSPSALSPDGPSVAGAHRSALFTDGAIAASWQAQDLGVGPYPLAFLARCVRAMGVQGALELPEPLIGEAQAQLARGWLAAAASVDAGNMVSAIEERARAEAQFARDELFAQWLDTVAAILATRRSTLDPSWASGAER